MAMTVFTKFTIEPHVSTVAMGPTTGAEAVDVVFSGEEAEVNFAAAVVGVVEDQEVGVVTKAPKHTSRRLCANVSWFWLTITLHKNTQTCD
jgi:hypothetical protein